MQPVIVTCDKCSNTFEIKPKSKKVKDDIKENYFQCPHCKEKYIIFHTNNESRAIQLEMQKINKQIKQNPNDEKLMNEYKQLESKHKMIVMQLTNKMKSQ